MALTYNKANRTLSLKCSITRANGTVITLADSDIVRYSSSAQTGSEGLPLGSTSATSYTLEIDNVGRKYTPSMFDNAEVHAWIGIETNGEMVYSDFGVWYVESSSAPEQSVYITLFGDDALSSRFSSAFVDSAASYPSTIGSLLTAVCTGAGIPLNSASFPNAAVAIPSMPEWGEEVTLRDIVSYCAICAGGFARITQNGKLEIVSYADGAEYTVSPELYRSFSLNGGSAFNFNCIEAKLDTEAEEYSRFAVNNSISDNATNTIQIDYNPLLTNAIVQSIVTELSGITAVSGSFTWGGDPAVRCGDFFTLTTLDGSTSRIMVTSVSFQFDGGLSSTVSCDLPSISTINSASYSTAGSLYDSNGNIRVTRISGLDGKVVSATAAHFEKLTASEISTDRLMAAMLVAAKLRATEIDAESVETDTLTAIMATIVQASIDKINAGTIATDELETALATIAAAQINTVNIKNANIDWAEIATLTTQIATIAKAQITTANIKDANIQWAEIADLTAKMAEIADAKIDDAEITTAQIKDLEATLADIVTAKIGTADIGFAQIKDLTAGTAIITEGVGGKLYISRLAVTEANMVSLTVGELIVKGSDGSFYAVSVDENGDVQTTLKQIGNADVKDLSINAGEKIIEGSITAACLDAENIFADNAIIRQLIAANMDVGTLFANDAFISHLNTADISGNEYLKLAVSSAVNSIDIGGRNLLTKTREFTPTTAAGTKIDDTYRDLAVRYLDCSALTSGYQDLAQWSNVVYPEYGERYALSFYAKGSGSIEAYFNGGTGYVKVKIIADSIEIRPSGDAALYVDSAGNATIGALTVDTDGNATLAADEDGNERLTVDAAGNATLAAGAGGSTAQTEDADESATSDTETYGDGKCAFELSESWTRYWVVYECASTGMRTVGKHVVFRVNHGDKAYVCGAKLEKGTVATDWSPAPEDAEGEISSLKTRVSAAELKITPDAIAATVKEKIEFGGRNLYKGTKDFSGSDWYNKTGWTEDGAYNGCTAMKHAEAWMGLCQDCAAEVGEYTLSAWAKCSVASTVNAYFVPGSTSSGNATVSQEYVTIPDVGTQWKRISATFNVTAAGNLRPRFELTASGKTLWICGLKLEKGNVATDWSPAPEDAEGEIGSLKTRVSAAETKITPTAIVSTVTSSESYQSLSSTASTAKSTAETAKTNAETAQSTADTAKTNAATAQSTANSAKSKADANESDIAALDTRVSTAELKITPTAIAATVKEKIEFGGRNLYKGTKDFSGSDWYNKTGWTEDGAYNGCTAMKHAEAWMGLCQDCAAEVGEYTLSAWAKCSIASTVNAYFVPGSTSSGSATVSQEYVTIPDVGTQWKRISATFNVTAAGNLRPRFELTAGSKTLWICGLKLEKGNVATDWSPAPEDAADSVYVDSSYSKVEINKDRVRIVSTQMEVAVPSEDGEDDVMRVDKDGVHAEVVETDMVLSESVVSTQGAASYTPADAGALAEILEELSGKYLTGVLSIDCQNVTSGAFEVENVRGPGRIGLQNGTMNGLKITSCDCGIYCSGTTFSTAGTGVMIENSERVHFSSCVFNAGVGVQLGNNWRSRARMTACTGTCTVLAKLMLCSELNIAGSSKPTGTLDLQSGSQVYNATSDPNFTAPSSGSVPTTQVATVSLSPTSTSTSGHSGLGSKLYQGRYSSSQSFRKGVMLFTLPSDLTSAANIESATLTIKRIAGVGGGGSVVAQIRCYDQTGTLYASKSVQNGQTVSIDVTSAVKAMKTNSYTGLMLYNPDTTTVGSKSYTTGYARFAGKGESGAPVLKVTYRK